jgi:hypothetical protein
MQKIVNFELQGKSLSLNPNEATNILEKPILE